MIKFITLLFWGLLLISAISSCRVVEYTPYDSSAEPGLNDLNQKNITLLQTKQVTSDTIRFALLADSHQHLDDLADAIKALSHYTELDFAVMLGDFTKFGLKQEFLLYQKEMDKLTVPTITVIGNHESVAEGPSVYRQMYGAPNFSFAFNNTLFVVANTNGWHFENTPDIAWLDTTLAQKSACPAASCHTTIVLSHIAPFSDQFTSEKEKQYIELMHKHSVLLSVHGHTHNFAHYKNMNGLTADYLVADNIASRNFILVTLADGGYQFERVYF